MDEEIFDPIRTIEPVTNINQMDFLREFLIKGKKNENFSSFVRKKRK